MKTDFLLKTIFPGIQEKPVSNKRFHLRKHGYNQSWFALIMDPLLFVFLLEVRQKKNKQKCIKIRVDPLNPYHPCSILKYSNYLMVKKILGYLGSNIPTDSSEEAEF